MNVPNLVYVYLAYAQPSSYLLVGVAVTIEQFGYGFGFTAYMLYMIMVSEGEHKTAHFAICTGFMALSMMLPGMISGWLQEHVGILVLLPVGHDGHHSGFRRGGAREDRPEVRPESTCRWLEHICQA
jgi:hypothetical protein